MFGHVRANLAACQHRPPSRLFFPSREHVEHGWSLPSEPGEKVTVARDRLLTIRGVTHQDLAAPLPGCSAASGQKRGE